MKDVIVKFIIELLKSPLVSGIIVLGILSLIFYKKIIGAAGEFLVKKELKKLSKDYLILNDIMLIINNKSTQIDHLVISKYGIFVIETKQYAGYITGNDYDKNWRYQSGKKTYYINNPIHQNYGHMQALKEKLALDEEKFIQIVCISGEAKVRVKSDKVVTINKLIEKITNHKDEILPNYIEVYNKITELNVIDKKARKQHARDVKEIKEQKEKDSANKCPKCGGELVERSGQYGKFIGCSNYPKCKFTKKIN